tara:strand:+ start:377 stop:721 length:345 start_codon:yes stop_codon:yes gene_type:complete
MEKKIIITQIGNEKELQTDYEYGNHDRTRIDEIIDFLIDAKNSGATHIEFDDVNEYEYNHCLEELTIKTVSITEESDVDFKKREESNELRIQNSLMWNKKRELKELERLKAKYE